MREKCARGSDHLFNGSLEIAGVYTRGAASSGPGPDGEACAPGPLLGLLKAQPPVVASMTFQSQLPAFLCPHSCTH